MPDDNKPSTYDAGLAVRTQVLGSEYVQQALQGRTPFNAALQDHLIAHCWGAVWTRPGLELKTRSLINIAMLAVLNRPHELKLHVRGALNNGLTREDIQEVFLQTCIYCGVPAALESFKNALEIFKEEDAKNGAQNG